MPTIELHYLEGLTADTKTHVRRALVEALSESALVSPDTVTVLMPDKGAQNVPEPVAVAPPPAFSLARDVVQSFLAAMEARDLTRAANMTANSFVMQFPGTAPMRSLDALVAWAADRYTSVCKTFEGFEACQGDTGNTIVYCRGTLHGTWRDGTVFEGIRFIDRFEITDGKITRQDVWNDIAEVRP